MTVHDEEFAGAVLGRVLEGEAPARSFADAAVREGARLRSRRRAGALGAGAVAVVAVVAMGAVYAPTWGSAPVRPGSAPATVALATPTPTQTQTSAVATATRENITALLLALLPGSTDAHIGARDNPVGMVAINGEGGPAEVAVTVALSRKTNTFSIDAVCPGCTKIDLGDGRWLVIANSYTDKTSHRLWSATQVYWPNGDCVSVGGAYVQAAPDLPLTIEEARRIVTDPGWAGLLARG
ncbi:hypothetical protein Lfu02_79360 [Longispora fulva]|uniref:Uncharacterized protein n=1 Tax=Longispora fulva TaxID=619741 RepID=A0A8J7KII5_9ACTN|nr:hypothetical protein [Longispora fulva]MBG6134046.1 hypothetical protein [Longispora fulva]GIG63564.1 hypothetical protein Lfu02_79360 [Longispora fulva]